MEALADYFRWVQTASDGDERVYHRGILSLDRQDDRALDRLAEELWHWADRGLVHLVQRLTEETRKVEVLESAPDAENERIRRYRFTVTEYIVRKASQAYTLRHRDSHPDGLWSQYRRMWDQDGRVHFSDTTHLGKRKMSRRRNVAGLRG